MIKSRYLPIIREQAVEIRKKYGLDENTVIGDYIFTILKDQCLLLQWPDPKQLDLDGFSTERVIGGEIKTVVYINSAKNLEKQNFCAAHELGHLYSLDRLIHDKFPEDVLLPDDVEGIMNRFAAELMMPQEDFSDRARKYLLRKAHLIPGSNYEVSLKNVLLAIIDLMNFYYVPYKAVVYRLKETDILELDEFMCERLLAYEKKDVVNSMISRVGAFRLRTPSNKSQASVVPDNIMKCLCDPGITKYISRSSLKNFLKQLGISVDVAETIQELQAMERENINIQEE